MSGKRKGEYVGVLGALLVHVAIIALLILVSFTVPNNQDEGGVPVMMGDVDVAQGNYDPATMVDVDVLPPEEVPEVEPQETTEQEMITQTDEETVAIKPKTEPKKEKPKEVKKPEKTAAEKAAEAKKLAEEKAERERKAAAEVAAKRVSGAFGKGAQMEGSKGTSDSGTAVPQMRCSLYNSNQKKEIGYHSSNLLQNTAPLCRNRHFSYEKCRFRPFYADTLADTRQAGMIVFHCINQEFQALKLIVLLAKTVRIWLQNQKFHTEN